MNNLLVNLIVLLFILFACFLTTYYFRLVSNAWSIGQETLYATIHSIVSNQINNKNGQIYFPLMYILFIFILVNYFKSFCQ